MKKIKLWLSAGLLITSLMAMTACGTTNKDSTTNDTNNTGVEKNDNTNRNDNSMSDDIKNAGSEVIDGAEGAVCLMEQRML